MKADLYAILGVPPAATEADIKRAYRAAAKLHHPDAGGRPGAMDPINDAYAVLSDPMKRREYDRQLTEAAEFEAAEEALNEAADDLETTAKMQAELLRRQAAQLSAEREAWARQAAVGMVGSSLFWLAISLIAGLLLRSQFTLALAWLWTAFNFVLVIVGGFGVAATIWPGQYLELYDISLRRRRSLTHKWWRNLGVITVVGVVACICIATMMASGRG